MSTTDHAFIRAYGQHAAAETAASPSLERPPATPQGAENHHDRAHQQDAMLHGETWRHESTGERIWVTRVPDAFGQVVAVPHETADQQFIRWDPANDTVMPPRAHFRKTRNDVSITPAAPTSETTPPAARSDSRDGQFAPSAPVSNSGRSPQVDGAQLGTTARLGDAHPPAIADFLPQWEVDQLHWPTVCDRLQRNAHHRLSEIVTALLAGPAKRPRVIGITSFGRGEGRTTLALALARLACGVNARVALVDGDLEHADLAQQVSIAFDEGWESWSSPAPLGEAAVLSVRDHLILLPVGQRYRALAESLVVQRAHHMLSILRSHLDLVLVDTGPMYISAHRWFRSDPPMAFDSALVIRDVRHSDPDQVDDVCCRLVAAGVPDAAIIENFQDQS